MNKELRAAIDVIDEEIVSLFARRMKVVEEISRYKREHGLPIQDVERENEKLQVLCAAAPEDIRDYVRLLYGQIFTFSKGYQLRLLGEDGRA